MELVGKPAALSGTDGPDGPVGGGEMVPPDETRSVLRLAQTLRSVGGCGSPGQREDAVWYPR